MSHWSDTAYKALGVAQEACRSRSLDEAIRAADNATNLLLEARNARDVLFAKRDKAWKTLAATHNLTQAERSLMRAGFYSAWELATGAGEEKDIPIQGSDVEDVPPSDTAKKEYEANAVFFAMPYCGTFDEVKTWANLIDNQSVFVDVPGPVRTRVGRVQNVEIKARAP